MSKSQQAIKGKVNVAEFSPVEKLIILYEYASGSPLPYKKAHHAVFIQKGHKIHEYGGYIMDVDLDHKQLDSIEYDAQLKKMGRGGSMREAFDLARKARELTGDKRFVHIALFNKREAQKAVSLEYILALCESALPWTAVTDPYATPQKTIGIVARL